MSNPLRNAMVYFGLADEEYDEAVPETRSEPVAARAATPRAAEAPAREHPSNVTPITPAPKPVPTRVTGEMNEILTVHPKAYNKDAQVIAENFRNGIPVIMNLSQMEDGEARRLIDFASGLAHGLYGKIERVTSRVFLLTPESIDVHNDERSEDESAEGSFFA